MPELPEVETIVRELKQKIIQKKIAKIDIKSAKSFIGNYTILIAKKIKNISRRAKILLLEIDGTNLAVHLKMTGQLIFQKKNQFKDDKYCRVIIDFVDGSRLLFNDLRKFGWLKIADKKQIAKIESEFGVEPFSKEFTKEKLWQVISAKKKAIKLVLMDQTQISGLGNIYANEVLFCAGILPKRPANKISPQESAKIYTCILKILKQAIANKGTSAENYVTTNGSPGKYDQKLQIYGKKGQSCPKCKGKIQWTKIGGRGTFYCSKCQK